MKFELYIIKYNISIQKLCYHFKHFEVLSIISYPTSVLVMKADGNNIANVWHDMIYDLLIVNV